MVTGADCILYYGVDIPNARRTRALTDGFLVLQPYHPICADCLYAEFFPGLRRFVYWNPTRLPLDDYRAVGEPRALGRDERWGTVLLDLDDAGCIEIMSERAARLLAI